MDSALVWFRNNLRTQDNKPLLKAIASKKRVIGAYFFDPRQFQMSSFGFKKTQKYRAQFLIETVKNLQENLKNNNITLLIFYKKPEEHIKTLIDKYNISEIHSQKEWTQEENLVTSTIQNYLSGTIIHYTYYDQFLFHPEDIPYTNFKDIPEVFTQFRKKCEKEISVRPLLRDAHKLTHINLIGQTTKIPNLETLGLTPFKKDRRSAFPFMGGEESAWQRLRHYFWDTQNLTIYKKTRNGLLGKDYSSKLSAWLANGSISAKQIYWEVKSFEKHIKKNQDTYWLIFELIWRDYFKYISLKHNNHIFKIDGVLQKNYKWKHDKKTLHQWINGTTQYNFVNANMIELKKTGWMSNRGRQNVASFWAKEQEQDWRIGAAYFESMLIDYDVHSNRGNWIYNAGVGNDPRNRKFNIKRQQELYDPNGKFVQNWMQNTLF